MVLPRVPNYSLYSEEPFLVIRAKKKKKNASEPPVVRASILTDNWRLWYTLLRKCFKYEVKEVHRYNITTCIPSYASDSEASLNIFSLRGMGQKTPKHLHFSKGLEYWLF